MCLPKFICTTHMRQWRPEEGVRCLGTGVTVVGDTVWMLGPNLGPLQEPQTPAFVLGLPCCRLFVCLFEIDSLKLVAVSFLFFS